MIVYTCLDNFESIMTCIYDGWEAAVKQGYDKIRFEKEPVCQTTFFDEYVHVDADSEKVEKVIRTIKNKISFEAYVCVCYASLSSEEDALDTIFGFLRLGFRVGPDVVNNLTNKFSLRMLEINRRVKNEIGYNTEKIRFTTADNKIYVGHMEPKNNVVYMVAENFTDRMPSENWMVVDDNRRIAAIHPKDEELYLRNLTEDEINKLLEIEKIKDEFIDMWKEFFEAISIKERENYECQRNHLPLWTRKHMTEFL